MITYLKSNLFFSPAQVLVNTVNTEGVMGKGIAKEFKKLFPEMFEQYQKHCEQKKLNIGNLWIYKTSNKWVLNFPTKKSWRNPSKLEYIEKGLIKFVSQYQDKGITSIAFPPLGCGNGELNWEDDVQPLMERYLKDLPIEIYIHLYTPSELEDVPEHKHIKNVARWLKTEPQFLSFSEVFEDLKTTLVFNTPETWQNLELRFTDNLDIAFKVENHEILLHHEELTDFWSILRKHGIASLENVPSTIAENYDVVVNIFSKLSYISVTKAVTNYTKIEEIQKSVALQLLPNEKASYDITVAI